MKSFQICLSNPPPPILLSYSLEENYLSLYLWYQKKEILSSIKKEKNTDTTFAKFELPLLPPILPLSSSPLYHALSHIFQRGELKLSNTQLQNEMINNSKFAGKGFEWQKENNFGTVVQILWILSTEVYLCLELNIIKKHLSID